MFARRLAVDAAIVAALLVATALSDQPWRYLLVPDPEAVADKLGVAPEDYRVAAIIWSVVTVIGLGAMLVRGRAPLIALAGAIVMMVTHSLQQKIVPLQPLDLAALIALYTVAAGAHRRRTSYAALGVTSVCAVIPPLVVGLHGAWMSGAVVQVVVVLAWVFGDRNRTRRAYLDEISQRAVDLERERDQQAELAVAAERARIARELHDAVAHGLSVIVIQAQAAAGAMERRPATAHAALAAIVATGRDALGEMRRLLGLTRPDGQELAPLPGLDDLPALLERVRAAGLPVTLHRTGEPTEPPTGVGLTAYRIVQEALTNALKHAGADATVDIFLHCGQNEVELTVADTGRGVGGAPDERRGTGLRGMRERVAMLGGTLVAADRPDAGFHVHATLPVTGAP